MARTIRDMLVRMQAKHGVGTKPIPKGWLDRNEKMIKDVASVNPQEAAKRIDRIKGELQAEKLKGMVAGESGTEGAGTHEAIERVREQNGEKIYDKRTRERDQFNDEY